MSSFAYIANKKKDILLLGKGPSQGLEHKLTAEELHSVSVTKENTKFCSSLHYNGANSYLLVNGIKTIKFKAKASDITAFLPSLGNI